MIRLFLAWLALNHGQQHPSCLAHYVDYLRVRLSEPATRGALKSVHEGFIFLDEVTGVASADRVTNSKMYEVVYKELLNQASPGRPSRQAPRMYISTLQGLDDLVCNQCASPYFRLYGWWILLQNWCTLRFGDHRGILPSEIRVDSTGLFATLSRSKTIGPDKATQARAIMLDSSCWIAKNRSGYVRDGQRWKKSQTFRGTTYSQLHRRTTWGRVEQSTDETRSSPYRTEFCQSSQRQESSYSTSMSRNFGRLTAGGHLCGRSSAQLQRGRRSGDGVQVERNHRQRDVSELDVDELSFRKTNGELWC